VSLSLAREPPGPYNSGTRCTTSDFLNLGATLTLTLNADGTTEGRLLAPGLDEEGGDVDVDLVGTWMLAGSIVTFDQPGDTFLPDLPFTADRDRLTGEETSAGTTTRVILTK